MLSLCVSLACFALASGYIPGHGARCETGTISITGVLAPNLGFKTMGTYSRIQPKHTAQFKGRPAFESLLKLDGGKRKLFLFYVAQDNLWVIGSQLGSSPYAMAVWGKNKQPFHLQGPWKAFSFGTDGAMDLQQSARCHHVKINCWHQEQMLALPTPVPTMQLMLTHKEGTLAPTSTPTRPASGAPTLAPTRKPLPTMKPHFQFNVKPTAPPAVAAVAPTPSHCKNIQVTGPSLSCAGVYRLQQSVEAGRPFYVQTGGSGAPYYLYFSTKSTFTGDGRSAHMWAIGREIGAAPFCMVSFTTMKRPENVDLWTRFPFTSGNSTIAGNRIAEASTMCKQQPKAPTLQPTEQPTPRSHMFQSLPTKRWEQENQAPGGPTPALVDSEDQVAERRQRSTDYLNSKPILAHHAHAEAELHSGVKWLEQMYVSQLIHRSESILTWFAIGLGVVILGILSRPVARTGQVAPYYMDSENSRIAPY
jgi:hypothetical protein